MILNLNNICYGSVNWIKLAQYYYYWYSALGPVWAETRVQSGDWYGSGTLHPGQVLRGSLPLLSPTFQMFPLFTTRCLYFVTSYLAEKLSKLRSFDRQQRRPQNCPFQSSFTQRTAQFTQGIPQFPQFTCQHHDGIISRHIRF